MVEATVALDVHRELELAEQQAAELWRQSEQIGEAYRSIRVRIDELRAEAGRQDDDTRSGGSASLDRKSA